MKLIHSLFAAAAVAAMTSCSSDDGGGKYVNMTPYGMDIVGAKSLIISHGSDSRAGADDIRAGLYKMDDNGKISAVCVVFSTDKKGNTVENSVKLEYAPEKVDFISDDFIVFEGGFYYKEDGTLLEYKDCFEDHQGFGYVTEETLIVNRNTGKIYRTPNRAYSWFQLDANTLYAKSDAFAKYVINGDKLTFTLIGEHGILDDFLGVSPSGVCVSGHTYSWAPQIAFVWPNGGYTYIDGESNGIDPLAVTHNRGTAFGAFANAEVGEWPDNHSVVRYYDINISSTPGEVSLDLKAEIADVTVHLNYFDEAKWHGYFNSYGTDEKAFCWTTDKGMLVYDFATNEMSVVSTTFNDKFFRLWPNHYFNNRLWTLSSLGTAKGYEVLWFDTTTLESGSFVVDLAGIDVAEVTEDITHGQIILKGTRRSDASNVMASVNLATEKTEILFTSFNQITIDYYPLN